MSRALILVASTCVIAVVLYVVAVSLFVDGCPRGMIKGPGGQCAQCIQDADCGYGFVCADARSVHADVANEAAHAPNICVQCLRDEDCMLGHTCNQRTNTCEKPCLTHADCSADNACDEAQGVCSVALLRESPHVGLDGSLATHHDTRSSCQKSGFVWLSDEERCVECNPRKYAGESWCDALHRKVACLRDAHCGSGMVCDNAQGACVPAFQSTFGVFANAGLDFRACMLASPTHGGAFLSWSEREGLFADPHAPRNNVLLVQPSRTGNMDHNENAGTDEGEGEGEEKGEEGATSESTLAYVLIKNRSGTWKWVVPHASLPLRSVPASTSFSFASDQDKDNVWRIVTDGDNKIHITAPHLAVPMALSSVFMTTVMSENSPSSWIVLE